MACLSIGGVVLACSRELTSAVVLIDNGKRRQMNSLHSIKPDQGLIFISLLLSGRIFRKYISCTAVVLFVSVFGNLFCLDDNLAGSILGGNDCRMEYSEWKPERQPSLRGEGGGFDIRKATADEVLDALWEPIRREFPQYCTRKLLGKDQTGQFDIWEYDFTPECGYKKTIILGGSLHGCEITGSTALALFMKEVSHCREKGSLLGYLRNNVRFITIPIQNPWGFNATPRSRLNGRGVDLARNADYKWIDYKLNAGQGEINYKGPAARSEIEGTYIEKVISEHGNATAFIDLHNGGPVHDYWLFTSRLHSIDSSAIKRVIDALWAPGETIGWGWNDLPAFYNWAADTLDMHAFALEFPSEKYGKVCSSEELTKAVRWYGNMIISFCLLEKNAKKHGDDQPFVVASSYSEEKDKFPLFFSRSLSAIDGLTLEFDCPREGILEMDGMAMVETAVRGALLIVPFVRQKNSGFSMEFMEENFSVRRSVDQQDAVKVVSSIPFFAAVPVGMTSNGLGSIRVGIAGIFSNGNARIVRCDIKARFTPSDAGARVRIFKAIPGGPNGALMGQSFPVRKDAEK